MVLLPTYPSEWAAQADERRIGHVGFRPRPRFHSRSQEGEEGGGMEDELMDLDEDDTEGDMDEVDEEEDEDEEGDEDEPRSPLTYPNTVPFVHAPRLPHLPSHQGSSSSWGSSSATAGPSRPTASFSDHPRTRNREIRPTRLQRQSFSIPRPGTGMPPIEYVTSRPMAVPGSPRSPQASTSRYEYRNDLQRHNAIKGHNPRIEGIVDEPRLLISNNDLTVKMFSLRAVPPRPAQPQPEFSGGRHASREVQDIYPRSSRHPSTSGQAEQTFDDWSRSDQGLTASRLARERLQRQLSEFQRIVGMQVSRPTTLGNPRITSASPSPPEQKDKDQDKEERKLVRIGGSKFKCAINHCERDDTSLKRSDHRLTVGASLPLARLEEYGIGRRL